MVEFDIFKEKKNEFGIPYLYLLRSSSRKDTYCIIKVDNNVPSILGEAFRKTSDEILEDDWENLTSRKKDIEKFIMDNLDADDLVAMDDLFFKPDEDALDKTYIIDFNEEE